MNIIIQCAQWAAEGHVQHKRKYNNRPYIEHPNRIACRAMLLPDVTEIEVGASFLHDIKEDNLAFWNRIVGDVPIGIVDLVDWLTNTKDYPTRLNRAERKALDRERISMAPYKAKRLKYLDRIDNVNSLSVSPGVGDFNEIYAAESELLRAVLFSDDTVIQELDAELGREIVNLRATALHGVDHL